MPDSSIRTLFVDTSSLRHAGFRNPDFQKLSLRSKARSLRILVSEIAWEEWRTYLREIECKKARDIRTLFNTLKTRAPDNRILSRLPPPALALWEDEDIDTASQTVMAEFATEHGIEIVPIGSDHAKRAWSRYFGVRVEPPFRLTAKDREDRRKDIPDSWIFEAAVDLIADSQELLALCRDDTLTEALRHIGAKVFDEPRDVVAELERLESPAAEEPAMPQPAAFAQPGEPLAAALEQGLAFFRDYEWRVLGYVAYLGTPTKGELFEALKRSGISPEIAKNTAERLVIGRLIQDTGHHYLVTDRLLAQTAAAAVEDDIIKLLSETSTDGL